MSWAGLDDGDRIDSLAKAGRKVAGGTGLRKDFATFSVVRARSGPAPPSPTSGGTRGGPL